MREQRDDGASRARQKRAGVVAVAARKVVEPARVAALAKCFEPVASALERLRARYPNAAESKREPRFDYGARQMLGRRSLEPRVFVARLQLFDAGQR